MNRIFILISSLFWGFVIISCNHLNQSQRTGNSAAGTNEDVLKENASVQQTMNTPAEVYAKPEVPVLCYHHIAVGSKSEYTVSPATFAADMKILADSGYHSILPAQLYDYLVYNKVLPEKPVMITFDDLIGNDFK